PDCPPTLRMQGALQVRAKRYPQGAPTVQRAIAIDSKHYQAHMWLPEAYLRLQRFADAHAQLHHGPRNAAGFRFVAWLLRFLIVAYETKAPQETLTRNRTEEFDGALRELCPELGPQALASMRSDELELAVEAALAALRGNRSIYASHVVDGVLTRL